MFVFDNIRNRFFNRKLTTVTAKNRLQMVLVQDRSGLSSSDMENFKKDLLEVIAKYFVIEKRALDVEWKRSESETALVINTPITGRLKLAKTG